MEQIGQRADFLKALLGQFERLHQCAAGRFPRIAQPLVQARCIQRDGQEVLGRGVMKLPRNGAPLLVLQMHEAAAQPGQFLLRAFDLGNVFMRDDDPARLRLVRPGHPELKPARPLRAAAGILHPELASGRLP